MNALRQFRLVAILEGLSFVALLFVAMPLKYLAGAPLAVRIAGSLHGLLFVLFVLALLRVAFTRKWSVWWTAVGFLASIVPFGTFLFDRALRTEIAKLELEEAQPPPTAA